MSNRHIGVRAEYNKDYSTHLNNAEETDREDHVKEQASMRRPNSEQVEYSTNGSVITEASYTFDEGQNP